MILTHKELCEEFENVFYKILITPEDGNLIMSFIGKSWMPSYYGKHEQFETLLIYVKMFMNLSITHKEIDDFMKLSKELIDNFNKNFKAL